MCYIIPYVIMHHLAALASLCVYLSVCGRGLSDDTEHMEPKILWQGVTDTSDLKSSPSVELAEWFILSRKLLESDKENKTKKWCQHVFTTHCSSKIPTRCSVRIQRMWHFLHYYNCPLTDTCCVCCRSDSIFVWITHHYTHINVYLQRRNLSFLTGIW